MASWSCSLPCFLTERVDVFAGPRSRCAAAARRGRAGLPGGPARPGFGMRVVLESAPRFEDHPFPSSYPKYYHHYYCHGYHCYDLHHDYTAVIACILYYCLIIVLLSLFLLLFTVAAVAFVRSIVNTKLIIIMIMVG